MNKKNVFLVLLIVCVTTVMLIGVFGNSAVTGINKNIIKVALFDEEGKLIKNEDSNQLLLAKTYNKEKVLEKEIELEDGSKEKVEYFEFDFYVGIFPKDASYPEVFADLLNDSVRINVEQVSLKNSKGEDTYISDLSPIELETDEECLVMQYRVTIKYDKDVLNGSCVINLSIDKSENKNTSNVDLPTLSLSWEYQKSDAEIEHGSPDDDMGA